MKAGLTGTRHAPTVRQRKWLHRILRDGMSWLYPDVADELVSELHHGACTGADELGDRLALGIGMWIVVHPPINKQWLSAECLVPNDRRIILPPRHYAQRNDDIVRATQVLIALPNSYAPVPHSGTWMTIGFAAAQHKPCLIGYPDGTHEYRSNADDGNR